MNEAIINAIFAFVFFTLRVSSSSSSLKIAHALSHFIYFTCYLYDKRTCLLTPMLTHTRAYDYSVGIFRGVNSFIFTMFIRNGNKNKK